MTLDNLLQTIAHVSKDDNKRLIHYVQQVPQDFNYYNTNGRRSENVVLLHNALVWACRNNMKLGTVRFRYTRSRLHLNLCLHLLQSSNITAMHTLKIDFHNLPGDDETRDNQWRRAATQAGVPAAVLDTPMTNMEFQTELFTYVPTLALSLQRLSLGVYKNEFPASLLTIFSHALEE